jgi:hypothetical protein
MKVYRLTSQVVCLVPHRTCLVPAKQQHWEHNFVSLIVCQLSNVLANMLDKIYHFYVFTKQFPLALRYVSLGLKAHAYSSNT